MYVPGRWTALWPWAVLRGRVRARACTWVRGAATAASTIRHRLFPWPRASMGLRRSVPTTYIASARNKCFSGYALRKNRIFRDFPPRVMRGQTERAGTRIMLARRLLQLAIATELLARARELIESGLALGSPSRCSSKANTSSMRNRRCLPVFVYGMRPASRSRTKYCRDTSSTSAAAGWSSACPRGRP